MLRLYGFIVLHFMLQKAKEPFNVDRTLLSRVQVLVEKIVCPKRAKNRNESAYCMNVFGKNMAMVYAAFLQE